MTVIVSGTTGITFPDNSTQSATGANATNITAGTVSQSYGGTGTSTGFYGFKNRLINGGMAVDQRNAAASQTFTSAAALAYSVDRWYGYCTGANVTGQQVAGAATPTVAQYRYKFTGAASVTAVGFGQRIEQKNCYDLAGSTCTLSADLASSSLNTVTWTASYATTTADTFGTIASPTVTQIATGTFTITSTVTNYSVNISVPAAATTGIQIVFTVGALLGSATWTIGNVQFELGSQATSFDYRGYGTEFALCLRYYEVASSIDLSGYVQVNKQAYSGYTIYPKRTSATLTIASVTNADNCTTISTSGNDGIHVNFYISASNGGLNYVRATGNTVSFSAEL